MSVDLAPVFTRVPASDLVRVFDDAGVETQRTCRDCVTLLDVRHFSTHAGGRRRYVCRACVVERRRVRDAVSAESCTRPLGRHL